MIRILYITRAKLSLSRAHTRNILKTAEYLFREEGVRVTVFSSAAERRTTEEIQNANGITHPFELFVAPSKRSLLCMLFRFRHSFDVLYFRDPVLWYMGAVSRFLFRKKVIFEAHGSHEWRFLKMVWLFSFYVSHGVVYITEKLHAWYDPGNKKEAVVVHANAPDFELYSQKIEARLSVRNALSIPPDAILLVYAGSGMWYDIAFLICLLPALPLSCVLLLVGLKEEEKKTLHATAVSLGVERRTRLLTRVSRKEFPRYLLAADILLIPPTLTYPGSICSKLYEYLAAGVPIVAHKAGANDEILRHGKNAFVVDSKSPKDYIEYILQVIHKKDIAVSMGTQAVVDAKRYTWTARAEVLAGLIRGIVH